jgi:hypothetical protein
MCLRTSHKFSRRSNIPVAIYRGQETAPTVIGERRLLCVV